MQTRTDLAPVILDELHNRHGALSLSEAARIVQMNPVSFRHRFRLLAGVTFRTARVRAKMHYGRHLLSTTTESISHISFMLGYSDRTKFEKAFRKEYGFTPADYRMKARSEHAPS